MSCLPAIVKIPAEFVFPEYHGGSYTPVDIEIAGCGLQNLPPGPAHVSIPIRIWGIPDSDFVWHYNGWWIARDYSVRYDHRDDTHLYGVTKYPNKGKIEAHTNCDTGYYNPNAYWTPPADDPTEPPPPGADPDATVGQDPTTVDPVVHNVYVNRPFHYADLKVYDQLGVNRTGIDLAEDPDHPGTFLDPYDSANHPVTFLYDEQDPDGSNLANMDWEPDGENVRNQQVSLVSANTEGKRGIRAIARSLNSWKEIGVFSGWDSFGGSNVEDASKENIGGHAMADVERYGRPPNFFKLYLHLEPSDGYPEFGEIGWKPMPFRDFNQGDRIQARMRKGFLDSGLLVGRIMSMKLSQADAENNVTVELECVPHMTDLSEITVDYWPS